jgi:hypothetical protein
MKTYKGAVVQLHHSWPQHWMEVSGQSCIFCFTHREKASSIHWIGGWVGPKASLKAVKRKISCPWRESNPSHPVHNPSLYQLSYPSLNDANSSLKLQGYLLYTMSLVHMVKTISNLIYEVLRQFSDTTYHKWQIKWKSGKFIMTMHLLAKTILCSNSYLNVACSGSGQENREYD